VYIQHLDSSVLQQTHIVPGGPESLSRPGGVGLVRGSYQQTTVELTCRGAQGVVQMLSAKFELIWRDWPRYPDFACRVAPRVGVEGRCNKQNGPRGRI